MVFKATLEVPIRSTVAGGNVESSLLINVEFASQQTYARHLSNSFKNLKPLIMKLSVWTSKETVGSHQEINLSRHIIACPENSSQFIDFMHAHLVVSQ